MDCNTGLISEFENSEDLRRALNENSHLAPITNEQHQEMVSMPILKRKGYMRNQSCVCGSGIKFKRCCWGKYK